MFSGSIEVILNELLFKVLAYNLCWLGEVAFSMKIDINSFLLCYDNEYAVPIVTCIFPQKVHR